MRREETREIVVCDFCGVEVTGDRMNSPETSFTRPDLDYFHGVWLGEVGEYYSGRGKDFCSLNCLVADMRRFWHEARHRRDLDRLGGERE